MSIIAFARLSTDESLLVERFCQNVWVDSQGDCTTVIEIILCQKNPGHLLKGFKVFISGKISEIELANDLYDDLRFCNWYYSRKGFQNISADPRVIKGDDLEFQVADAHTELTYFTERDMSQVAIIFDRPIQHSRAGLILRFKQKNYGKRFRHQWTVDERIYDRKSILARTTGIETHIDEKTVLPFTQGYIWIILPPKKLVSTVAPQPRNLRHMEEPGLAMLGEHTQGNHPLRMMIHWRTEPAEGAWDAKRFSAIYVDQPLPNWMIWGAFLLAILSIILSFLTILSQQLSVPREPPKQNVPTTEQPQP